MRDVDDGGLQALVQQLDLGAHFHAQLGVQVRQRFVEQEQRRLARNGAAHGHALALAARQLRRTAVQQVRDLQGFSDAGDDFFLLRLRHFFHVQAERDVFAHRHRRVQRVGLEHHGDVAVLRRQVVDDLAVDEDFAGRDAFQAGHHVEQGRLAGAGAADEDQELAILDLDVDALEDFDAIRVHLADAAYR
ncbi:hypothetical protein D3C72_1089840 [compost metagenome]